jgi:hypothetical protein
MSGWFTQIAAGSSTQLWGINSTRPNTEHNLWRLTLPLRSVGGFLTCLSASWNGVAWGVDATQPAGKDHIYRWSPAFGWKPMNGFSTQIAVAGLRVGSVWEVDTSLLRRCWL